MKISIFPKKKNIKVDLDNKLNKKELFKEFDNIADKVIMLYKKFDIYDKFIYSDNNNTFLSEILSRLDNIYINLENYIKNHPNKYQIMTYIANNSPYEYSNDFSRVFYMWKNISDEPRTSIGRRLDYFYKVISKCLNNTDYLSLKDLEKIIFYFKKKDEVLEDYKKQLEQITVTLTLTIQGARGDVDCVLKDEKVIRKLEETLHCKIELPHGLDYCEDSYIINALPQAGR